jgi:hypothetical protein
MKNDFYRNEVDQLRSELIRLEKGNSELERERAHADELFKALKQATECAPYEPTVHLLLAEHAARRKGTT